MSNTNAQRGLPTEPGHYKIWWVLYDPKNTHNKLVKHFDLCYVYRDIEQKLAFKFLSRGIGTFTQSFLEKFAATHWHEKIEMTEEPDFSVLWDTGNNPENKSGNNPENK